MTSLAIHQPTPRILAELATRGPRYTSYPPAPHFRTEFGAEQAAAHLWDIAERISAQAESPGLSLYAHVPFCKSLCWYCGCNVKITRDRSKGERYIDTLLQEIKLYGQALPGVELSELSLGGGSPNFLSAGALRRFVDGVREAFPPKNDARLAIELDPRDTSLELVDELADMGFTRINVGVQDFELKVQDTINRHQSREDTEALIAHARAAGFQSTGVDLIYGLPGQSEDSFTNTLEAVLGIAPDRIALFGYAHLPHIMKHQLLVEREPIPDIAARAVLLTCAIQHLTAAGYIRVGFDHFALPHDPMAKAVQKREVQRNFQGFTTTKGGPLLACGVTGISDTGDAYWQNTSDLEQWQREVEAGRLPIARGLALSPEDHIRRHLIYRLMCDSEVSFAEMEERFDIKFSEFFEYELQALKDPDLAQLVEIRLDQGAIAPTPLGFELIRNLCMVFDPHLRGKAPTGSTTI
ncbi:MAG: oxygen-independent coproporphyrinogen III oxidase [Myxococcales bacterium]|nr:oxygen-independent coproporphyrinogen III oxidase [Myxococcales bacterium]